MDFLNLISQNLLSPAILFFVLGVISGLIKSDLDVPKSISRYLSIYLMMAIGFKGGVAIAATPEFTTQILLVILAGILFGFIQPFLGYFLLKITTKIDKVTAAAVAAHYGSISMVTFVTATSFLQVENVVYAGYIVAVLALMEAPAILSGLFIAHKVAPKTVGVTEKNLSKIIREIFTNGAILLLTASFLIGWITADGGMKKMEGFLVDPFQGILALFLLDMGIMVSKQTHHLKEFSFKLVAFAIYMPILSGVFGVLFSSLIGLDLGTGFLFAILCASASYIAVPAAMHMALPKAKSSIYLTMSLAITFPFNIVFGIPLYYELAKIYLF